jgi:hypothetical protein
MGHHRRGRSARRDGVTPDAVTSEGVEMHGSRYAGDRAPEAASAPTPTPRRPSPAEGVGARPLEELVEAARTARRTGWTFGSEVLATADTRGVPTSTPPPRDGQPRRYATHQPTAPIMIQDAS